MKNLIRKIILIILFVGLPFFGMGMHVGRVYGNTMDTYHKLKTLQPKLSKARAALLSNSIEEYSNEYDIDKNYLIALGFVESSFINQYGDDGASMGYFQIQLPTADTIYRVYSGRYKMKRIKNKRRLMWDVDSQVQYATLNLKRLKNEVGTERGMFLAYNAGVRGFRTGRYNPNYYEKIKKTLKRLERM